MNISSFKLKMILGIGFFATVVIVMLFIQFMKKVKKSMAGEERQAPDFVLENIRNTLSQKKLMKEELTRTEKISSSILRNVDIGIGIFDNVKVMKSANPAFMLLFGLEDSFINNSITLFRDFSPLLFNYLRNIRLDHTFSANEEHLTIQDREIDIRSIKIDDETEEFRGFIVLASDVTEIERVKKQLELKKRMEVIGEMSAGIAHEFRNSLATLKGYSQMIEVNAKDEKIHKYAENILNEVQDINTVVDRFLLYAKPLSPVFEPVTSSDVENMVKTSLPDANRFIKFNSDDITFKSDMVLLKQCVTNILKNAIESCTNTHPEITMSIKSCYEGNAKIEFQDNGCGMGEDTIVRAFIPFYTTKQKGTGLGLALCEKIAASLNGKILIDSTKGEGTKVTLLL